MSLPSSTHRSIGNARSFAHCQNTESYPVDGPEGKGGMKRKGEREGEQQWDMTNMDGKEIKPTLENALERALRARAVVLSILHRIPPTWEYQASSWPSSSTIPRARDTNRYSKHYALLFPSEVHRLGWPQILILFLRKTSIPRRIALTHLLLSNHRYGICLPVLKPCSRSISSFATNPLLPELTFRCVITIDPMLILLY